jgi:hypothetical protein
VLRGRRVEDKGCCGGEGLKTGCCGGEGLKTRGVAGVKTRGAVL